MNSILPMSYFISHKSLIFCEYHTQHKKHAQNISLSLSIINPEIDAGCPFVLREKLYFMHLSTVLD